MFVLFVEPAAAAPFPLLGVNLERFAPVIPVVAVVEVTGRAVAIFARLILMEDRWLVLTLEPIVVPCFPKADVLPAYALKAALVSSFVLGTACDGTIGCILFFSSLADGDLSMRRRSAVPPV